VHGADVLDCWRPEPAPLSHILHADLVQQLEFVRWVMQATGQTSLPVQVTPKQAEALLAVLNQGRDA
jgi:hypothetical protein